MFFCYLSLTSLTSLTKWHFFCILCFKSTSVPIMMQLYDWQINCWGNAKLETFCHNLLLSKILVHISILVPLCAINFCVYVSYCSIIDIFLVLLFVPTG